jgi:hypothetical protein
MIGLIGAVVSLFATLTAYGTVAFAGRENPQVLEAMTSRHKQGLVAWTLSFASLFVLSATSTRSPWRPIAWVIVALALICSISLLAIILLATRRSPPGS